MRLPKIKKELTFKPNAFSLREYKNLNNKSNLDLRQGPSIIKIGATTEQSKLF